MTTPGRRWLTLRRAAGTRPRSTLASENGSGYGGQTQAFVVSMTAWFWNRAKISVQWRPRRRQMGYPGLVQDALGRKSQLTFLRSVR